MSMTTTSGLSSRALRSASRPSSASPTTSMSACAPTSERSPSRSIMWSSANRIRKVFTRELLLLGCGGDGDARARRRAPARRRLDAETSADQRVPLAQPQQAQAAPRPRRARDLLDLEPAADVFDDDEKLFAAALDDDV